MTHRPLAVAADLRVGVVRAIDNDCEPATCSAGPEDVCGTNIIGGGTAPLDAAGDVYACACGD